MVATEDQKNTDEASMISEATSERVCKHMNEDHTVSVFAMAKAADKSLPLGYHIEDVSMRHVDESGCQIQLVHCKGNVCELIHVKYLFNPPLKSASELKPRLVQVHHEACTPSVSWLFTKPLALVILIVELSLAYGTYIQYTDELGLAPVIESNEALSNLISTTFGSADTFAVLVKYSFYLSTVLHSIEAVYVAYSCRKLKLRLYPTVFLWYLLISLVGIPITQEFLELLAMHNKTISKKSKKKVEKKTS